MYRMCDTLLWKLPILVYSYTSVLWKMLECTWNIASHTHVENEPMLVSSPDSTPKQERGEQAWKSCFHATNQNAGSSTVT